MKLLIMKFSPLPFYLVPLRPKSLKERGLKCVVILGQTPKQNLKLKVHAAGCEFINKEK
jgi:hypothetical protein